CGRLKRGLPARSSGSGRRFPQSDGVRRLPRVRVSGRGSSRVCPANQSRSWPWVFPWKRGHTCVCISSTMRRRGSGSAKAHKRTKNKPFEIEGRQRLVLPLLTSPIYRVISSRDASCRFGTELLTGLLPCPTNGVNNALCHETIDPDVQTWLSSVSPC